ncbi:MAG: hypothetical protein ACFB15_06600 [Cyclobacteriaceae bacterium]
MTLKLLSLTFLSCIIYSATFAQQLTDLDKEQITELAEIKLENFETLLRIVSDASRSRGARNRYIVSSYSDRDSLFNQIFYDENVIVEDDISPIEITGENVEVSAINVTDYLNKFNIQYQKGFGFTVFFSDPTFSEIANQEPVYVVASYTSEFRGKNINDVTFSYQPVARNATFRAEYDLEKDRWQVWIAGINFDRTQIPQGPQIIPPEEVDPLISQRAKSEAINYQSPTREAPAAIVIARPQLDSLATNATISEVSDGREETILPPTKGELEFPLTVPSQLKRGQEIPLTWNRPADNGKIELYQNGRRVSEIKSNLYSQQWAWPVEQKPGKNYSLVLYEPNKRGKAESRAFQIKSKFPLAVKIAIPVAVVAGVIVAVSGNDPGPEPRPGPGPDPDPDPTPSRFIDIEPRTP